MSATNAFRHLLLATTALVALVPTSQALAQTLPTGGSVAAGSVTITQPSAMALRVDQTSPSAITNWQSFSIGTGARVDVVQPSTQAAMLARVTGSTTSTIAGTLTATGQLVLVNPNGIAITSTGAVAAGGGFVASSLAIRDDDFLSGKWTFTGTGASAGVSNAGTITVGSGGYAALLGGTIDQSGTISVPLGRVGLGSGEQATLDFSGDGFLQVGVPTAAPGSQALIEMSGTIRANGGRVEIKAAAAREAARHAINLSGVVEARTVRGRSGDIVLGGSDGKVSVSGRLVVSSRRAKAGKVTITGREVALKGATIDARGATGGGTVRIGGDRQGAGTLARAETTTIDAATRIDASATSTGDGGSVVVWADGATAFAGTIVATGGLLSGNGGEVEVSGKGILSYSGFTDLSAVNGAFGTLLLDPYNVTISSGADANTLDFTATGDDSVINAGTLATALGSANVTVSTGSGGTQAGNITVAASLTWSAATTLTLSAAHALSIDAPITVTGAGGVALVYDTASTTNLSFGQGGTIDYGATDHGGTLTINGQSYTLLYGMAGVVGINGGLTGRYALAHDIDAVGTTYTTGVIAGGGTGSDTPTPFSGTLEGLGHTISNLTIAAGNKVFVGLIGYSTGTVRDIGLIGGTVSGAQKVGGLIGTNSGTVTGAHTTGTVTGTLYYAGGLVGFNTGAITKSYATGAVTGSSEEVGGLVGVNVGGAITQSYATGTVSGTTANVGGLVGLSSGGTIAQSYATGAVSAPSSTLGVGGLVGNSSGTITQSYATGAVTGGTHVGGLVGRNYSGSINQSYATGAVTGQSSVGGLVGNNLGTITQSWFDTQTSGQASGIGLDNRSQTVTGLTTRQLQGLDPISGSTYFSVATQLGNGATSAFAGGAGGIYPYLSAFFPSGVQAVSGIAYKDGGTTALASGATGAATVSIVADGAVVGTASTGANGYYYVFVPAGTFAAGDGIVAYTRANVTTGAKDGASFTQSTGAANGNTGLDVWGGWRLDQPGSGITTLSALDAVYAAAIGTTAPSGFTFTDRRITASGSFTLDGPLSATGTVTVSTPGDLTIAAAGTVSGSAVTLAATGAFVNLRGSDAVTATSARWLVYSATPSGDTFGGLDSGATAIWNTAAGAAVSQSGNRYVFAYRPTLTVTSTSSTKVYGEDAMSSIAGDYTITGVEAGVSGAYLGDAAATAYGGTPTVTSLGADATAGVSGSPYAVTVNQGTLSAGSGYALSFVGAGTLTVTARPITVTADAQSRVYGDANPTLAWTVGGSGLVNGDTLSGSLATTATTTSGVGTYAIDRGTLAASSNYALTWVGADLTVTARPITVTATSSTRIYGEANPALTWSIGGRGLANGDTLVGGLATTATALSPAGAYSIGRGTLAASRNYAMTFVPGVLTIEEVRAMASSGYVAPTPPPIGVATVLSPRTVAYSPLPWGPPAGNGYTLPVVCFGSPTQCAGAPAR